MASPDMVERKIYFYHANIGYADDGAPLLFNPIPALQNITSIVSTPNWYEEEEYDGSAMCLFPDASGFQYPIARFGKVRRQGLPQLEQAGQVSELGIAEEAGLLESVHAVFFPNNIVGAEYNQHGPRLGRLGNYLRTRSNGHFDRVLINPIVNSDAAAKLDALNELHLLRIHVLPTAVDIVEAEHPPIARALDGLARALDNPLSLELVLRPVKDSERNFLQEMRQPLQRLLRNLDFRREAKQVHAEGRRTGIRKLNDINLLKDDIVASKAVSLENPRGKALETTSVVNAIIAAYNELRPEIINSPTLLAIDPASGH